MIHSRTLPERLELIPVGCTAVIHGEAVTRWGIDSFEITTWGRDTMSLADAVKRLALPKVNFEPRITLQTI